MWPFMFARIMVCMAVFPLFTACVLITKRAYVQVRAGGLLPGIPPRCERPVPGRRQPTLKLSLVSSTCVHWCSSSFHRHLLTDHLH